MSEQIVARPQRFVPPLPAGIPILPGQVAARRLPRGRIILLVLAGLVALIWFNSWRSGSNDDQRINAVVTQAMLARVSKRTRLPVTLRSGPRMLQIEYAIVQYPATPIGGMPGGAPTTCAMVTVLDPKTGAKDPNYPYGNMTCIEGLSYRIH
jgi:hypothetical protein